MSPRQPALIPGVLFGEVVLRNLPRAYQLCVAEANRRIADFRRRNLASSSGSASMPPPAASASMPPPAASPPMPPPVFPPLPPPAPLAVAQAKHAFIAPASGVSGLDMGLRFPAARSPGSACNVLIGSGGRPRRPWRLLCHLRWLPPGKGLFLRLLHISLLVDSFPPMQWNRPTYEGKGGDALLYYGGMRTTTGKRSCYSKASARSTGSYAWSEFAPASCSNDASAGYATRTCYPTSAGYAFARRFGESAATSISGVRYCFGCGCARYGILGIKRQCTFDGPTKWDALYVYTFQVSSERIRMHENGPAECSRFCCCLEGAFAR